MAPPPAAAHRLHPALLSADHPILQPQRADCILDSLTKRAPLSERKLTPQRQAPNNGAPIFPENLRVPPSLPSTPVAGELSPAVDTTFLVCSYTDNEVLAHIPKGHHGKGIYSWQLNGTTGQLTNGPTAISKIRPNPAFLLKHPTKEVIFASTECIHDNGEVISLAIDPADGHSLRELGRESAGGRSTCYLAVSSVDNEEDENNTSSSSPKLLLGCVNYWDAIVSLLPLDQATGTVSGPILDQHMQPGAEYVFTNKPDRVEHWTHRQRWPHTHCFVTEPYEKKFHFVPDLGQDIIWCYRISKNSKLVLQGGTQLEREQGPRHIVFHPTARTLYVINELKSTVSVLHYHPEQHPHHGDGTGFSVRDAKNTSAESGAFLQHSSTQRTLPDDFESNDHHKSHASEIRLHPSNKFLFIANRGHDSIAVFAIDDSAEGCGALTLAHITPSGGVFPRNFNFDSTGRFVVVGNQNSNNLTVFALCLKSGAMKVVDTKYMPSPNFVYALT